MKKPSFTLDDSFARFGAKSFAIDKINSVEVRERHPHSPAVALLCGLAVIICVLGGRGMAWLGMVFAAIAVWGWFRSRIVEYQLLLTTSSQEVAALTSRDLDAVARVRQQIEAAMASRRTVRT